MLCHTTDTLTGGNAESMNEPEVKDNVLKDYHNDELVIQNNFTSLISIFFSSQKK